MNKEHFLRELAFLLSDVEEDEREEALAYYRDLLDEAGPEHEAETLEHIGSPERVAAELKYSLHGGAEDGEYTERGYYDERFDEYNRVPDHYTKIVKSTRGAKRGKKRTKETEDRRRNGLLLLLLFLFFGLPLAGTIISAGFSVIAGVAGALFGIFGGLLGLIAGGIAAVVGLVIGGVGMIIAGAANLVQLPTGLMGIGIGFWMLAAALLVGVLTKWGATTAAPGLLRFTAEMVRRLWGWLCGLLRRIFRKGGGSE